MSDKVRIERELLERLADIAEIEGQPAGEQARAILSTAQSAPDEREAEMPSPDEIHQMAFEEGQPADDGDGYLFTCEEFDCFVQRLLDSLASWQRAQSAPAGAPESEAWLQEWARDKFTSTGRYKGSVYGNTDWALARALHSAMLAAAPQLAARHEQGDEVRRLREAIAGADDVLAALTACTTPLDRLERKYGKDWGRAIDNVRAELINALAASAEGKA